MQNAEITNNLFEMPSVLGGRELNADISVGEKSNVMASNTGLPAIFGTAFESERSLGQEKLLGDLEKTFTLQLMELPRERESFLDKVIAMEKGLSLGEKEALLNSARKIFRKIQ